MADKKPRKCLSVPQAFSAPTAFVCSRKYLSVLQAVYPHNPRLSAPAAFIRTASLFHARRIYLRRTPFFSAHRTLSAPQAVAFSRFSGK